MVTHVGLLVTDRIYDGLQLTKEVQDWLESSIGKRARDMTELRWTNRQWLFKVTNTPGDPTYMAVSGRDIDVFNPTKYIHFQFYERTHAVLFKLAWGGK